MVFDRIPWYLMVFDRFSMVFYDIWWYSMVFYGVRWCLMVFDGILWYSMVFNGILWCSMVSDGVWWYSKVFNGIQLSSMVFNGLRWNSMVSVLVLGIGWSNNALYLSINRTVLAEAQLACRKNWRGKKGFCGELTDTLWNSRQKCNANNTENLNLESGLNV